MVRLTIPRCCGQKLDNVGMEATGERIAAEILEAIRSGQDLWVLDQFIGGPYPVERVRKLLIERRDACSDPDDATFFSSIIRGLEKGDDKRGIQL